MHQSLEYEQGQHKARWNPAHADGVCLALAAYWIIENAAGRDFRAWLDSAGAVGDAKDIYQIESSVKSTQFELDALDAVFEQRRAAGRRLPFMGTHRVTRRPAYLDRLLTLLADRIARKSGRLRSGARVTVKSQTPTNLAGLLLLADGYKLVNWRVASLSAAGHADAAHAIGVHVSPNGVRFFEPNSGEWETTRGRDEFVPFFGHLCTAYGIDQIDLVSIIEFI
jgi:hypothetical protein